MPDQIDETVKEERNHDLLRVVDALAIEKSSASVDRRVQILCEGLSKTNPDRMMGRSPGNKIVIFEGAARQVGEIFDVQITHSTGFSLYGNPVLGE